MINEAVIPWRWKSTFSHLKAIITNSQCSTSHKKQYDNSKYKMHTYWQMLSAEFANQNESRNDLAKHSIRLASIITTEHRSILDRSTTNMKNSFKTNETMAGVSLLK